MLFLVAQLEIGQKESIIKNEVYKFRAYFDKIKDL
jgi:hypothetical protein